MGTCVVIITLSVFFDYQFLTSVSHETPETETTKPLFYVSMLFLFILSSLTSLTFFVSFFSCVSMRTACFRHYYACFFIAYMEFCENYVTKQHKHAITLGSFSTIFFHLIPCNHPVSISSCPSIFIS